MRAEAAVVSFYQSQRRGQVNVESLMYQLSSVNAVDSPIF